MNRIVRAAASLGILALSLAAAEGALRLKNASMRNYDIEMWRYARELKTPSDNALLGHEHLPNREAILQSTLIRTNAWGLRGGPVSETPAPGTRRIMVLGGSLTLGWGVAEDQTVSSLLQKKFDEASIKAEVLNAGIGNYNAQRYIERFLIRLAILHPTDILVLTFPRDGEALEQGGGNWLLRNSELAVIFWIAANRLLGPFTDRTVEDHYRVVYTTGSENVKIMRDEFEKLARYAVANNVNVTIAMVPDIHNLVDYRLNFVNEYFAGMARYLNFSYIDTLPFFQKVPANELWAMPGDPHPNALGHAIIADAVFPLVRDKSGSGAH